MVNSLLRVEDIQSEIAVVRNEREARESDPLPRLLTRVRAAAYRWQGYGRDVLGEPGDLNRLSPHRLRDYYQIYYQPDNAVLTVTGNFNAENTLQTIRSSFGPISRPSRRLPSRAQAEPPQEGERMIAVRGSGGSALAIAAYHIPGATHADAAPLEVLAQVLGAPGRGTLGAHIGARQATTTEGAVLVQRDSQLLILMVHGTKGGDAEALRKQFEGSIGLARTAPPTAEQVERSKAGLVDNIDAVMRSSEALGSALSDYIGLGDWRFQS